MNFTEADKMEIRRIALERGAKLEDADSIMNWEIVDELKDWNLESEGFEHSPFYRLYQNKHIKKCRDLIIKDLYTTHRACFFNDTALSGVIREVINKRFGDLK